MIQFPKPTVEQFLRTYNISDFAVSQDEKRLIFSSNLNGSYNLWAIDFPNQFPYLFSQKDEASNFISIDKEGRFVLAGFDHEGDENYHMYALPYDGGIPKELFESDAKDKFFFAHLTEDGKRLYYNTSIGNESFLNTKVRDLESGEERLLHEGDGAATYLAEVSDDEETLIFLQTLANTYIKGFALKNGEKIPLVPDPEKVHTVTDVVFAGGDSVYLVTDFGKEFSYVASFNLAKKEFAAVAEFEKESVTAIKRDNSTDSLYIVTEKGVEDHFYRYSLSSGETVKLEAPVKAVEKLHIAKSGTLYVLGRSAIEPSNIFRSEDGEKWERITSNKVLGVPEKLMVEPDVVTYSSFDGMEIEALLFKAKPKFSNGYTIFWPHGGPQAAERKVFRAMFQSFLNRGYTIFAPNFRGSTGYGSEFVKLVEGDWGEGPRKDCVAGLDWLIDQGITNPEKLFLVGGSYGGYMALLLAGRHPEYFRAVIDIFGPSNLFSFLNSVPAHWKPMMEQWLGDAEKDKERLTKDSPITYLDTMEKPMFVIQGANDPRVVKEESDQIVAALREKGRDVEYLVLEDEGHGFSKKENEIKVYTEMLKFLEKHQ